MSIIPQHHRQTDVQIVTEILQFMFFTPYKRTCLVNVFLPQRFIACDVKFIVTVVPATLADLVLRQSDLNVDLEL